MPRKPRDQLFKRSDIYRLIESARRKGLHIARIDVEPDGKLSLIVGETAKADSHENKTNPWDEVLNDAANEKRPA